MAVVTLHHPTMTRGIGRDPAVNFGNFLDLSTEQVHLFDADKISDGIERGRRPMLERFEAAPGAILATDPMGLDMEVDIAFVGRLAASRGKSTAGSISFPGFGRERLAFDLSTYEDADGDGTSADDLRYSKVKLKDIAAEKLGVGARFVLRFSDPVLGARRYFRILIQRATGYESFVAAPVAFREQHTAFQFEELKPNRIIVPLGIKIVESGGGAVPYVTSSGSPAVAVTPATAEVKFATAEDDVPAHYVHRKIEEIMWSIRPANMSADLMDEIYQRPLPVANVVFKRLTGNDEDGNEIYQPDFLVDFNRPPPWVGGVRQRNIVSRSYMNTTYSIAVSDGDRPVADPSEEIEPAPPSRPRPFHRYKYDLYLIDGGSRSMRAEKFDPPVDVDDGM